MNILLRADASAKTGGGHMGRCIALAQELGARGNLVEFATRADDRLGTSMLTRAEIPFRILDCNDDWQSDAKATRETAQASDWVVVDHYGLDDRWETQIKESGSKILVIDDLASRRHDCDILVDAGRAPGSDAYRDLLPPASAVLLGPRYSILRREFRERQRRAPRTRKKNILVFFGSVDGSELTIPVLEALDGVDHRASLNVHVVVTDANPRRRQVRQFEGVIVHENVPSMATVLGDMDMAIGAAGLSMWERCRMGIPSLTIAVNDNQKPGLEIAASAGAIVPLALEDARSSRILHETVSAFVANRSALEAAGSSARQLVDGKGAVRIASLCGSAKLRRALREDCRLIWNWANDSLVRQMAFNTAPIPYERHIEWYDARLNCASAFIRIAEIDGDPAGQIRFEFIEDEKGWLVDISVARKFRGRGLGLELLQKALLELRRDFADARAVARVKKANRNSIRLFESAGFFRHSESGDAVRFVDDVPGTA